MRHITRRLFAFVATLGILLATALPVFAGGGLSDQYFSLEPGKTYDLTRINLNVPLSNYGYSGLARLSGPDASGGSITLEEGKGPYNFVWEQSPTVSASYPCGSLPSLQLGYTQIDRGYFQQFPIDGKTLFGFSRVPLEFDVKMTFTDVQLTGRSEDLFMYDEYYAVGPYVPLVGKITIEITTTIDGTFTLPAIEEITSATVGSDQYIRDIQIVLEEVQKQIDAGVADGLTVFDQPKTVTATIELDGTLAGVDGYPEMDVVVISSQVADGKHTYTTTLDGITYSTLIRDASGKEDYLDQTAFSIGCPLYADARWSVTPYGVTDSQGGTITPGPDDGYDVPEIGYGDPAGALRDVYPDYQYLIDEPGKALLIAAGTGAAALGVSMIISLIGDTAASAAASTVSGTATSGMSGIVTPGSSAAGSSSFSASTLGDSTGEDDEETPQDIDDPNDEEAPKKKDVSKIEETPKESSDADNSDSPETPDLPEEDSPEVSMSLFAPDKDLLNVKGGAASITVQIEGGEGYLWNYLPTVICPGTLKAIVPTVTGRSHLATLNLGMTGAKLSSRHYEVFVTLIAWTTTPDGKLLKTSKTMEMKLHEPGIEAKKNADGSLTVNACVPTTLKGFADVRTLSPDEYTCTTLEDGTLEITAIDTRLGSTQIKP